MNECLQKILVKNKKKFRVFLFIIVKTVLLLPAIGAFSDDCIHVEVDLV